MSMKLRMVLLCALCCGVNIPAWAQNKCPIFDYEACLSLAEQGHAYAQYELGRMHEFGLVVQEKDYAKAVHWYRRAAEQGHAEAQSALGGMYSQGHGVAKDDARAALWYRKAAEQGDAHSQLMLGWMYHDGRGVQIDYEQTVHWWRKAAEQGDQMGQFSLGLMYEGVNNIKAYKWISLVAAQGAEDAEERLTLLEAVMSPKQIAIAKKQAAEWQALQSATKQ